MSKQAGEKRIPKNKTKIMVFGTFDGLHPGHLNFFKQARALSKFPYLIASVARDKNVLKIKGKLPRETEQDRLALVGGNPLVDKAVLSGAREHIPHILKERPDMIALGYDQKDYIKNLKTDLAKRGLPVKIFRLRPYKEKIYKSSLLKRP